MPDIHAYIHIYMFIHTYTHICMQTNTHTLHTCIHTQHTYVYWMANGAGTSPNPIRTQLGPESEPSLKQARGAVIQASSSGTGTRLDPTGPTCPWHVHIASPSGSKLAQKLDTDTRLPTTSSPKRAYNPYTHTHLYTYTCLSSKKIYKHYHNIYALTCIRV